MSESLRPMRPIQRHPFAEEVLPVSGGPHAHHSPKPPAKPCTGTGLHSEARVKNYVQGFKHLQQQWPKLSPEQRRLHIQNLANKELHATGAPPLTFRSYHPPDAGTGGEFDFQHWVMNISDHYTGAAGPQAHQLSDWDAKVLATMIYHESRHSEQWYLAARKRAADLQAAGGSPPQQQAAQIAQEMSIPLPIAQRAQQHPLPKSDKTPCAQQMYDSIFGVNAAHRNSTLTNFHAENVNLAQAQQQEAAAQAQVDAEQKASAVHQQKSLPHDLNALNRAKAHLTNAKHQSDLATAAYEALPEEADAYATGHQVEKEWDGKLLQW